MKDFLRLENRYHLTAELVLETPLHIGIGGALKPAATDLPVAKNPEGKPFIPGSSAKGILRSTAERLLRTFELQGFAIGDEKIRVCEPLINPCIEMKEEKRREFEEKAKEGDKINDEKFTKLLWEETCHICRLFGSPWIASRISVKDLTLKDSPEPLQLSSIRQGIAILRDTGTVKSGALYDYEVVSPGARFSFEAVMENVEPWEVGLFALILKLWERGEIALGGKKTAGLGKGRLESLKLEKVEEWKEFIIKGTKVPCRLEDYIAQFEEVLKKTGG